jgi:hypothetical protein
MNQVIEENKEVYQRNQNLFKNINEIPLNESEKEVEEAEAETEEEAEEIPELVLSNEKIENIMEESNVTLSNLLRKEKENSLKKSLNQNKNIPISSNQNQNRLPNQNQNQNQIGAEVQEESLSESLPKSRSKRINRSQKLMTLLSTVNKITVNQAKQKLNAYAA